MSIISVMESPKNIRNTASERPQAYSARAQMTNTLMVSALTIKTPRMKAVIAVVSAVKSPVSNIKLINGSRRINTKVIIGKMKKKSRRSALSMIERNASILPAVKCVTNSGKVATEYAVPISTIGTAFKLSAK